METIITAVFFGFIVGSLCDVVASLVHFEVSQASQYQGQNESTHVERHAKPMTDIDLMHEDVCRRMLIHAIAQKSLRG